MADIADLIAEILDTPKLKNTAEKLREEYRDEPILRTAAQMVKQLPQPLADAKKIALSPSKYNYNFQELFYRQGMFLADFTDDCTERAMFTRYYPTYHDMTNKQLRTYFTWRTNVRRGIVEKTSASYAMVYCYELLNQISVPDPETGYQMLLQFQKDYSAADPENTSAFFYFSLWMHDYVIRYHLSPSLLTESGGTTSALSSVLPILAAPDTHTPEAVTEALTAVSRYTLPRSRFFRENAALVQEAVFRCFCAVSAYFENRKEKNYLEYLFGKKKMRPYHLFGNAVYFEKESDLEMDYVISPCQAYHCRRGLWYCESYFDSEKGTSRVGDLLKTIDQKLRLLTDYAHPLKEPRLPKYIQKILDKELEALLEEQRRAAEPEPPKIKFDLSQLQTIRRAADTTRDKLLVEEEVPESEAAFPDAPGTVPPKPEPEITGVPDSRLSETETALLRCLLEKKPYDDLLRQNGVMLSVLADHINDILFDDFGDTVILFDGDTPELIEDYAEDIAAML